MRTDSLRTPARCRGCATLALCTDAPLCHGCALKLHRVVTEECDAECRCDSCDLWSTLTERFGSVGLMMSAMREALS